VGKTRQGGTEAANLGIFKRKHSQSVAWLRPVEAEYLRRQVQLFQRKNSDSQKDLQVRLAIHRQKNALVSLNAKRNREEERQERGRVVVSDQDIDQIKRLIARGGQRTSLVHLLQEECLPAIRALH
jgi:ribosomal protein L35